MFNDINLSLNSDKNDNVEIDESSNILEINIVLHSTAKFNETNLIVCSFN